ncbi:hypothetical protein FLL45_13260 [Aliikangiella marina]|uniref:DUF541 domain-containing protein n=1 Tax=Aliikangiella marina TaxID=1712262 RepID=A0A545T9D3_9GAMM|nr:hypothetical protein [Aliikangiella marina]TQV73831.1 hypothetical protein FLL45_13260 [Aliikangiella marina]
MKFMTILIVLFSGVGVVSAADSELEIVVTGSRITDYDVMPAVTITKSADFLVQEITLVNDSRSPKLRKSEIMSSINNLVASAKKLNGIEISYGEGFLSPVNLNDDSIQLIQSRNRVDTNYVELFVKVAFDKTRSAKEQIAGLRNFISKAKLVSRTEIEVQGDIGLTVVSPEQYRYDILKKINTENLKVKGLVGGNCEISISGLENRVMWERTDISALTLYIPYETDLKCG